MNEATVKRLNAINHAFYATAAAAFDETRARPWPGWDRLLPYLRAPLPVLDVGCGNGRFGRFLAERLGGAIRYHGLDSSPALLARAAQALAGMDVRLDLWDAVEQPPPEGAYELVALFGVLHHVPGAARRQALVRALAECVAPGGLLAFTTWRFHEQPRFRQRIVPWPDEYEVESGDYLLDWRRGARALRYCHYADDAEHAALVRASGLREVETFRADGDLNAYSVLRRDGE